MFGYRSYDSTLTIYDSTLTIHDNTLTTYGSTYTKNVLELILMVKFWVISILLYIYHQNNNLQINSGFKW